MPFLLFFGAFIFLLFFWGLDFIIVLGGRNRARPVRPAGGALLWAARRANNDILFMGASGIELGRTGPVHPVGGVLLSGKRRGNKILLLWAAAGIVLGRSIQLRAR